MKLSELFYKGKINEGLITSVDPEKFVKMMTNFRMPSKSKWRFSDNHYENSKKRIFDSFTIIGNKVKLKISINSKKTLDDIFKFAETLGWFASSYHENGSIELNKFNVLYKKLEDETAEYQKMYGQNEYPWIDINIFFEAKYDERFLKNINTLYHLTPSFAVAKIKKLGLIPKALSKMSQHPARIYFCTSSDGALEMAESLNTYSKYFISDLDTRSNLDDWTLLEINTNGLKLKLYKDPNFLEEDDNEGVYTLQNIPPSHISVIKEFKNVEKNEVF